MQKSGLEQGIKQVWVGIFTVAHPPFSRACSAMQALEELFSILTLLLCAEKFSDCLVIKLLLLLALCPG